MTVALAEALASMRARIDAAAARVGRRAEEVTLVAVTKGVPAERIAEALTLGVRDLGENRVQEMEEKRRALGALVSTRELETSAPRWHMIGTLQRNKVRSVVGATALVHSIDSVALARALGARAAVLGIVQDVLLQVNTSGEESKHGIGLAEAAEAAEAIAATEGIALRGLMTMAAPEDRARARASFQTLRMLREDVARAVPEAAELSMGMSGDFEEAIEEGATIVRVGSALFGARPERLFRSSRSERTEKTTRGRGARP